MRPIDLDRWQRIEPILDQALELPADERSAFLDHVCAGDPDLRAEVEALLSADEAAGSFLAAPAAEDLLLDEAEEEDLVGHQVGPYRLLREIGGGGMGTVYEAEDPRLGRRIAVKILPPEYSRDRKAKERFLREARAAAAVDHPNICAVYDVGEWDGGIYIILPFYEGETLRDRIRLGPLPLAESRDLAIQIARGLACAHEAGIIHRDIKPANVMLTQRGEAKILDFGIARLQGDEAALTRTGASWGTPAYMSPEQARGERVDARTDVWSLGVLLYEMIAGRRPFGGESMEAVISAILTQKPEPIENLCPVSEGLARIIDRALAKDPNQRYSTAAELLADLESGSAAVRRTRPKWLRMNLLIGAAALVVSGASLLWSRFSAAPPPIRVAILQPEVSSHPETNSIAHEVVEAALASLLTLDGVQPLDTPERDEKSGSLSEIRRAAEADETVRPQLNCDQGWCRVTLHRQNRAREVLATVEPFEVSEGIDKADTLADAMRAHVRQLYPDRARRPDAPGAAVRPEDYSAYIELERRIDDGRLVGKQELDRVDSLLRTSPDLIGAYVLAAGIARNQGELDRALDYAARAEKIAPHDPRPLFIRLRIEVKQNRLDAAEATLGRLSSLAPGDIRVMQAEAELLEANEDLEKAHPLRQEIVRRRPIWRYVHDLAMLELSLGASEEIWEHLRDILAEQPNNVYILEDMAALETSFGDLKRAAALYEQLLRIQPTLATLTNLGFIRYILADYPAATRAYRRALTLEPDNPVTRFNLATSLEAQGNRQEAHDLYREIDHSLASPSDTHTRLLRAQCLLRSGRRDDAALLTREVLRQRPDDVQALYQAAQLYALLGDHYAASYYAKLALEQGMRREWFMIPEFSALQEDPSFRALLVGKEAHKLSS